MSDPARYRSRDEVSKVREERDPIERMKGHLLKEKIADEPSLKKIDTDIKNVVLDAAEYAQNSPEPEPSDLYTDILVES